MSCDAKTACPGGGKCCAVYVFKNGKFVIDKVTCGGKCETSSFAALCDPAAPNCPSDRVCKPVTQLGAGFNVCSYQ